MVLWKGKQNWQTSGQAHQEEKKENPNKQNKKWERKITRDTTEIQKTIRVLWTIICQQIGQPRRNGQLSRNI